MMMLFFDFTYLLLIITDSLVLLYYSSLISLGIIARYSLCYHLIDLVKAKGFVFCGSLSVVHLYILYQHPSYHLLHTTILSHFNLSDSYNVLHGNDNGSYTIIQWQIKQQFLQQQQLQQLVVVVVVVLLLQLQLLQQLQLQFL
jgi:hypothetical protein